MARGSSNRPSASTAPSRQTARLSAVALDCKIPITSSCSVAGRPDRFGLLERQHCACRERRPLHSCGNGPRDRDLYKTYRVVHVRKESVLKCSLVMLSIVSAQPPTNGETQRHTTASAPSAASSARGERRSTACPQLLFARQARAKPWAWRGSKWRVRESPSLA